MKKNLKATSLQTPIHNEKRKLGELLKDINLLSNEQIEQALSLQKKEGIRFGDAVVKLGFLNKDDINWALSNQLNIPYISDLTQASIYDPASVWLLPYEFAKKNRVIVIGQMLDTVNIVMADPLNKEVIDQIKSITGKNVNVSISDEQAIIDMIEVLYRGKSSISSLTQNSDNIWQAKKDIEAILHEIGTGFDTEIYKNAISVCLKERVQKDVVLPLKYKANEIGTYKMDLIVDNVLGVLFLQEQKNLPDIHSLLNLTGLNELIVIKINSKQINLEALK